MIVGMGIDLVCLSEFEKILEKPGSQFVNAHFTELEISYAGKNPTKRPVQHLAARYAAKEAFIKALGQTNFNQPKVLKSVNYKEIEVVNDEEGRPMLKLHGRVTEVSTEQGVKRALVSIAHDGDYATAQVILEN
jgi:holo-[acyl-carrier protein] synthase